MAINENKQAVADPEYDFNLLCSSTIQHIVLQKIEIYHLTSIDFLSMLVHIRCHTDKRGNPVKIGNGPAAVTGDKSCRSH